MSTPSRTFANLVNKIKNKSAVVGVIGLGHVGTVIGKSISDAGFPLMGFDIDSKKIKEFNIRKNSRYFATNNQKLIADCDILLVCVPTPVNADKEPDLTLLELAMSSISKNKKSGQLIITESSIAPGTTRKQFQKYFAKENKNRDDIFFAHSPERIDPGNKKFQIENTPKIVAGINNKSLLLTSLFYQQFVGDVISASSLEAAELSKMLENTFRLVNISFVNELELYTEKLGVSLWEVIQLSSTKPYGFLPHFPGPGIGGHCIPVDPYYLLKAARDVSVDLTIVNQALLINEKRTEILVKKILTLLGSIKSRDKKVLLIGMTYKPDIKDIRESAGIKILNALKKKRISVFYHDPLIPHYNGQTSNELTKLSRFDLVVIITNHTHIDYSLLQKEAKLILDTRNVYHSKKFPNVIVL